MGIKGLQVTVLPDQVITTGQQNTVQVTGLLPPNRLVYGVEFIALGDFTEPGGGPGVALGTCMFQLLANLSVGRRVNISGLGLRYLEWLMNGRSGNLPADCPAVGGVYSRAVRWFLRYTDNKARNPSDGAIATELFTDPLVLRWGAPAAIFAANAPTFANAALRTIVWHGPANNVPGQTGTVPASVQIMSEGDFVTQQQPVQKAGIYSHALLFREQINTGGPISDAMVTRFTTFIDGSPLLQNIAASEAAALYNRNQATGTDFEVPSATVPQAGELLNNEPGAAAAAGQGILGTNFLPIVIPHEKYKLSELAMATGSLSWQVAGTLGPANPYRVAYRLIEPRPDSSVGDSVGRLGLTSGVLKPNTDNGKTLSDPVLSRFVPLTAQSTR